MSTPSPQAVSAALAFARHQNSATKEYVDAAMGLLPHVEDTEYKSQCAMRILADKVEELAAWKEQAMTVSRQWDVQVVGQLLNVTPGHAISPAIEPGIRALLAHIEVCRDALRPFANYACAQPHPHGEPRCHNCIARDAFNLTK